MTGERPVSNWLAELLEALERHSQAVQSNTAAIHSLLEQSRERGITAGPGSVQQRLLVQLEEALQVEQRLEQLRRELAPIADTARCVYMFGDHPGTRCRLPAGHPGVHETGDRLQHT